MDDSEGRAVRTLLEAAANLRQAMFDSDAEDTWKPERDAYQVALDRVEALPGMAPPRHGEAVPGKVAIIVGLLISAGGRLAAGRAQHDPFSMALANWETAVAAAESLPGVPLIRDGE